MSINNRRRSGGPGFAGGTIEADAIRFAGQDLYLWPVGTDYISVRNLGGNLRNMQMERAEVSFARVVPRSIEFLGDPSAGFICAINNGQAGLGWGDIVVGGGPGDSTYYLVQGNGEDWTILGK